MWIPQLLVTDDDHALRHVVCEALSTRGFHVHQACDGDEAIAVVERSTVHFCLVDFHMPGRNGLEVIEQIHSRNEGVPCVLMSGQLNETIRTKAERLHPYRILDKPLKLTQVRALVCNALSEVYGWSPAS